MKNLWKKSYMDHELINGIFNYNLWLIEAEKHYQEFAQENR